MDNNRNGSIKHTIIIGGGIAGLSSAIHLAERGIQVTLVDAEDYPRHRICGAFFSPESFPLLERWGIKFPITIKRYQLFSKNNTTKFLFKQPAHSISRYRFDEMLCNIAREKGVNILLNTKVEAITQATNNNYQVKLSSGNTLETPRIIIGTGRATNLLPHAIKPVQQTKPQYIGLKAHFKGTIEPETLFFYAFNNAYAGFSAVDHNTTNIACLARYDEVQQHNSPQAFMNHLAQQPHAQNLKKMIIDGTCLFDDWMICAVPSLGIKKPTPMENIYFVGDTTGGIPPVCGEGLSISLMTGKMVTDYVVKNDWQGFASAWHARYRTIYRNAMLLHNAMMNPSLLSVGMKACNIMPWLTQAVFNHTRLH